jgi:transposase-like protein
MVTYIIYGEQATLLKIVTDKLRSYSAARREVMPSVAHSTQQYENNRCEFCHRPGREQQRIAIPKYKVLQRIVSQAINEERDHNLHILKTAIDG